MDTNQINSAFDTAQALHARMSANWPAICAVAVLVARELKAFNAWLAGAAGFVIQHGGAALILKKLIWNPASQSLVTSSPTKTNL